jgi:hypothetical protein
LVCLLLAFFGVGLFLGSRRKRLYCLAHLRQDAEKHQAEMGELPVG